jgi:hypothetical protein
VAGAVRGPEPATEADRPAHAIGAVLAMIYVGVGRGSRVEILRSALVS